MITKTEHNDLQSLKELLLTHIERIDKAVIVAHDDLVRVPTDVTKSVGTIKELLIEKIESESKLVDQRFELIEKYRVEQKTDTATAVTAALSAAKEAVSEQNKSNAIAIAKSEAATTKQIDQMALLIANSAKSSDDKIDDIKGRISKIESSIVSFLSEGSGKQEGSKNTWGIIASVIGIILLIVTLINVFHGFQTLPNK